VVLAKIYDVSPSGTVTLVNRLVSPARLSKSGAVTLTLPGVVHQYAKGDRIELVIAATDQAYIGDRVPDLLTVSVAAPGSAAGSTSVLRLPVVPASRQNGGGSRATGA